MEGEEEGNRIEAEGGGRGGGRRRMGRRRRGGERGED